MTWMVILLAAGIALLLWGAVAHAVREARKGRKVVCPNCAAFVPASDLRAEPYAFGSVVGLIDAERPWQPPVPGETAQGNPRPRPHSLKMCSKCDPARNGALEKWEAEREGQEAQEREEAAQEERERDERWAREDAARKGERR